MRTDPDDLSTDNVILECDVMYWRSILCIKSGKLEEAIEWARKCVELCEKSQMETSVVRYLLLLAKIYMVSVSSGLY
jgi:hypothetical protein